MSQMTSPQPRQVLIVSSHPLFGKGIQRLLQARQADGVQVVGIAKSVDEAVLALDSLKPNLVVVDYDDGAVNRDEFLARFVESEHQLRVVLLSLKEGGSNAIVYDRRSLEASQVDDWLQIWSAGENGDSTNSGQDLRLMQKNIGDIRSTNGDRSSNMRHAIGALIVVALVAVAGLFALNVDVLLPRAASAQALPIDSLFGLHFQIMAVLFGLIIGIILYSAFAFRRKPGDTTDPVYQKDDNSLSIDWVIIVMGGLFVYVVLQTGTFFKNLYAELLPSTPLSFDVAAAILSAVIGLAIYGALFLVKSGGGYHGEDLAKENGKLEMAWTALPLGMVLAFAFLGSDSLAETLRVDPRALEINVTGQQWSWRFEYPEYGVSSSDLVLPRGRQVVLNLTSIDVIHSFWVPEFRVKQDAVPGVVKELRVTATEVGQFMLACAEICGTQHAYMTATVDVKTAENFDAWAQEQMNAIPEDPIERGALWYERYGCQACHTLDGSKLVGPSFQGVYGKVHEFEDGTTATADEAYLYEAIREPGKRVVKGYPNAMPAAIAAEMTDEQIADLIEFIKSLK